NQNQNQNRPRHCHRHHPMTNAAIRALIAQGVADALAEQEIQRNTNLNGDVSQGSGSGITRLVRLTRECTYNDFLKCQPLNFKGTEGVVGLTHWFKRMETVFHISNYVVENQVKFVTCTLLGTALTCWNSHVKTVGHDVAYGMPWKTLMKMMTVKYCPRSEIKKLEIEIWNLKVKGGEVCRWILDMIQGNVMSARPKTMQEAIELANDLMDQKVRVYAQRQAENKRKFDNNNQAQKQLPRRQNVAQAYAAGTGKRKEYARTLPLCNKCKFHHNGQCTTKCVNCKKAGHLTRDCWNPTAISNQRTITCHECGNQGHYKSDCPELKNRNPGYQAEGTKARTMVYVLGEGETNQDLDDMEDDINS
nr:hypothetical protein [Tanacetum cinerariifolium]